MSGKECVRDSFTNSNRIRKRRCGGRAEPEMPDTELCADQHSAKSAASVMLIEVFFVVDRQWLVIRLIGFARTI